MAGVRFVSADEFREGSDYPSFERWVGNIIYRQGGVTVEPYYNKVMDFGMEFEMVDGKVLYRGLSLSTPSRMLIREMFSARKTRRWR